MTIPIRESAGSSEESRVGSDEACEEFQSRIPLLMGGDIHNEEHLKSCLRCSSLVEELEYIAEAARLFLAAEEPPDTVWKNIENKLPLIDEKSEATSNHTSVAG